MALKEIRADKTNWKKSKNVFRYETTDRLDRGAAIIKQLLKIYI